MAITGTVSLQVYPLVPGATTAAQPVGASAVTFTTAPKQFEADSLTYTPTSGPTVTFNYYPTMQAPGDLVSLLRSAGVVDATLDRYGRLSLPSGSTLTANAFLGF